MKILRSVPASGSENGTMYLIVQHPYDYLIKEFQEVFVDHDDIELKVDSRLEERRRMNTPFSDERRQGERRRMKDTLVEIVIAA